MRYLVILLTFFMYAFAYAQQPLIKLNAGIEKYQFLHEIPYFQDSPLVKIKDSLEKLQEAAKVNDELSGSIRLLYYDKAYRERLTGLDTTEYRILRLAAEAHEKNLKRLEADALQTLAEIYKDNKEQQSAAIEQYLAAYAIYKNLDYSAFPLKQHYTYNLGVMMLKYQDYANARIYLLEALHTKTGKTFNEATSIATAVGLVFRNTQQYDSAINYFQVAYDSAVRQKQDIWFGISKGNIGICYFYKHDYTGAEPLLKEDIESSIANSNLRNAVGSMIVLATIYSDQGKFAESERLLLRALSLCYKKSFWHDYGLSKKIYGLLYVVYGKNKKYQLSYLYCDSALRASDSAVSQNNAAALAKVYEKQNYLKKKLADEKLLNETRLRKVVNDKLQIEQQQLLYKFIIGFLVVVLIVAFIVNRFRNNLKQISTTVQDSAETVVKKMSIVIISIATCAAALVWTALYYYYYGFCLITTLPFIYFLAVGPALIIYFFSKKQYILVNVQLICIFFCTLAIELASGGFKGGIVILWAFLAPVGALMYQGLRNAIVWMVLFITAILFLVVFHEQLANSFHPIPETAQFMFNCMNILGPAFVIYFSMQFFVKSVIRDGRLLQENNLKLSSTLGELELATKKTESAYQALQETHIKLVQSEKMAVLGQLAAGVAHEVNTPLGAIKSSAEEAGHAFDDVLSDCLWMTKTLNEKDKDAFLDFVMSVNPSRETLSTREEREIKKTMRSRFAELNIENAHYLSDRLVQVGIYEMSPALELLAKHEHFEKLVMLTYNILNQKRGNQTILLAVDKASRIVRALKTYAHTSDSNTMEPIDLRDNMETVLTMYHNRLKQGVTVIKNYENVPQVLGFPDQLNQVWTNLIVNAVQAMDNKGTLSIGIFNDGENVTVSIKDTGNGIPLEIQDKIFTPFFTTKGSGEGSGLGLDIISRILESHGASISFDSEEGVGTTFYVKIPAIKPA